VQSHLFVRWRIAPAGVPRVLLHCPRCERDRWFVSSGRFRVNAQKKRLDAWLIYGCGHCGRTWNFPLFERLHVRAVDPVLLERLHGNCRDLAAERGSDLVALARHVREIEAANPRVAKMIVDGAADASLLRIAVDGEAHRLRADRLLAAELGRPRSRIAQWMEEGVVICKPAHRLVQDGQAIEVALSRLSPAERHAVVSAAAGTEPT